MVRSPAPSISNHAHLAVADLHGQIAGTVDLEVQVGLPVAGLVREKGRRHGFEHLERLGVRVDRCRRARSRGLCLHVLGLGPGDVLEALLDLGDLPHVVALVHAARHLHLVFEQVVAVHAEDATGEVGPQLRGQEQNDRCDELRLGLARDRVNVVGHARLGHRRDAVDRDLGAPELHSRGAGEAGDPGLGRGVVALAEVAHQPRDRAGVDDAAALALLFHLNGRGPRAQVGAFQMHVDDRIPDVRRQLHQGLVPEDARVVDQDVEAAEVVDRNLDDVLRPLLGGDVVEAGRRFAAQLFDLGHDLLGHGVTRPAAVARAAEIVHDYLGALAGKGQGICPADSAAGAGDCCYFAVEETHRLSPFAQRWLCWKCSRTACRPGCG
jgi:hypothetical protein